MANRDTREMGSFTTQDELDETAIPEPRPRDRTTWLPACTRGMQQPSERVEPA